MTTIQTDTKSFRSHWEWGERHAAIWSFFCLLLFAGSQYLMDEMSVGSAVRIQAFILLALLILVNAVWRAAGAIVARLESHKTEGPA